MEQTKSKVYTFLPFLAEVTLVVAVLSFVGGYISAVYAEKSYSILCSFFCCLFYFVCLLNTMVSAILLTILNRKQRKGQLVLSEINGLNIGPNKTYILADNWYLCFVWLWFIAMALPFFLLPFGIHIAITVGVYLIRATILLGVFVSIRATYLSIKQAKTKKAES